MVSIADTRRLAELERLRILDTPPEADFDAAATLSAAILRSPVAAVNLVDDKRHFTKAVVGMPEAVGGSVPNELSFCAATVSSPDGVLVIEDTRGDDEWSDHPLVTGGPRVGFYVGASIVSRGERVGVVCAYGPEARPVTEQERSALMALAETTAAQMQLRLQNAELQDLAVTDPLTGLPNRALLMDRLQVALAARRQSGTHVGVLFCDVDDFKAVNDTRGHAAGDEVLCHVAASLRSAVRDGDTVARIAGDEFVALCPSLGGPADLDAVVARLEAAMASRGAGAAPVRLSVGAVIAWPDEDATTVLRRADAAMYVKKARHGRRVGAA